jgi:hypothetical protein
MAKEKKGAKFGRHSRNPSSKLYPMRADRNARRRVERHAKRMAKKAAHRLVWQDKQSKRRPIQGAA